MRVRQVRDTRRDATAMESCFFSFCSLLILSLRRSGDRVQTVQIQSVLADVGLERLSLRSVDGCGAPTVTEETERWPRCIPHAATSARAWPER